MVRFKNRYLYAEYVLFPPPEHDDSALQMYAPSASGLASALRASITTNFGLAANAKLTQSLSVKYFNPSLRCALVRCARDALPQVWLSLNCLPGLTTEASSSGSKGLWTWRVLAVSGSLRGCQKGSFRSIERSIRRRMHACKSDSRPEAQTWRKELGDLLRTIRKQLDQLEP